MLIHMGDGGSHLRGPNHAPVEHAGHTKVMHELKLAGHESDSVERGNWLAQHGPLGCRPPFGRWVEREVEVLAPDKICIRDPAPRAAGDDAVVQLEMLHRLAQLFGSQAHQSLARSGRGKGKIFVVEVGGCGLASRGGSLVGGDGCVALDQLYPRDGHAQFLGNELGLRSKDALTKIALAGIGGDGAVGAYGQP